MGYRAAVIPRRERTSAFTRVFDALWRANPESITTAAEYGFRIAAARRPE
jgi:hypothetical protein